MSIESSQEQDIKGLFFGLGTGNIRMLLWPEVLEGRFSFLPNQTLHPWNLSGKQSSWEVYLAVMTLAFRSGDSSNLPPGFPTEQLGNTWSSNASKVAAPVDRVQQRLEVGSSPTVREGLHSPICEPPLTDTCSGKRLGVGPRQKSPLMDPVPRFYSIM